MGISLIKFNGNKGILRCNHVEKENTITILTSIKKISSNKIKLKTLGTSGTIKALNKKHMNKEIIF